MTERPYSPAGLAERWQCSAQLVRNMLERGDLKGFRHGKMWRIPAAEVARFEGEPAAPPGSPAKNSEPKLIPTLAQPARHTYGWPQAMKRKTAAAYCEIGIAAFETAIEKGLLPTSFMLGGREHWHRPALDNALERLAGGLQHDDMTEAERKFWDRIAAEKIKTDR